MKLDKKRGQRLEAAQNGYSGVKEIKLYERENYFIDEFNYHTFVSLNAARNQTILQQVPKISLEFIAIFVLCTLIGVLFFWDKHLQP